ncbi:MAG: hypothetical protein ACPGTU_01780 [Myxococcota bacterium]
MEQSKATPPLLIARIIWGVFLMSLFTMVMVAFTVTMDIPPITDDAVMMAAVSGGMALTCFGCLPLMTRILCGVHTLPLLRDDSIRTPWNEGMDPTKSTEILAAAHAQARIALIIGLALCESCVIIGLVTSMTTTPIVVLPFAGVALTGLIWQFPTDAGVFAIARAMRKNHEDQ